MKGGKRPGTGRKPTSTEKRLITLSPKAVVVYDSIAKNKGKWVSALIEQHAVSPIDPGTKVATPSKTGVVVFSRADKIVVLWESKEIDVLPVSDVCLSS